MDRRESLRAAQRKYAKTAKGKATQKRWRQSAKGRDTEYRYRHSAKGMKAEFFNNLARDAREHQGDTS